MASADGPPDSIALVNSTTASSRRFCSIAASPRSKGEELAPMRIDIVTLFPELLRPMIEGSSLGRAQTKGLAQVVLHDLWEYVPDGERADDAPYGGGPGMVMRLGPIVDCLERLVGGSVTGSGGGKSGVASPG